MPYSVGGKGTNGCKGYPVIKEGGEVVGCHATRAEADQHLQALYANVPDAQKDGVAGANPSFTVDPKYPGVGIKRPQQGRVGNSTTGGNIRSSYAKKPKKVRRGTQDFMGNAGNAISSGGPGGSMGSKSDIPGDLIKAQGPCWEGYAQRGMKPGKNGKMVPNCVPVKKMYDLWEDTDDTIYDSFVTKAEGYSPPAGARAAARRAIKFKEDGKATGAGTAVGWTRAGQLARGETLSLSTVKRMYSYFSRHEVDKKGKDWANQSNPSNGYIMWLAWGGDAGFSWARGIVEREKQKMDNSIWDGSAFEKRDYAPKTRQDMAQRGEAMPDGSYPIANERDLHNAIQSFGRASNPSAVKEHIKRRARALGMSDTLPDTWKSMTDVPTEEGAMCTPDSIACMDYNCKMCAPKR